MKTLIILLLLFSLSFAQYDSWGKYGNYLTRADGCTKYITSDANTLASWIFDNVNNSTPLTDLSGNGNTLTPSAGFDYANQFTGTSMFCDGTSLKFDGVDDYFSIPYADATDLNMGTGDFTIEALFTTTSDITSFQPICIKSDNNANHKGYMVFINGGNLIVRVYDGSGTAYFSKNYAISTNTSYYFAMSLDRDAERFIYLNGSNIFHQNGTNFVDISSNYNFHIGTDNTVTIFSKKYFMQVVLSSIAKSEVDVERYYTQDYTGPTILSYTATGVQYDSVQHVGSFTAESGAYYGIFESQDTTATNLLGSWQVLTDFNTTLLYDVTGTTNQTFYLAAKDSLDNVSWASDAATIEDAPAPPITLFTATGDTDNVAFSITADAVSGGEMLISESEAVADSVIGWVAHGNLDSTISYNVGAETYQMFYVITKLGTKTAIADSDDAVIVDSPDNIPPNIGAFTASLSNAVFNSIVFDLTNVWGDSGDVASLASSIKIGTSGSWTSFHTVNNTSSIADTVSLWSYYYRIDEDSLFFRIALSDSNGNVSSFALDTIPKRTNYVTWQGISDTTLSAITYVVLEDSILLDSIKYSVAKIDTFTTDTMQIVLDSSLVEIADTTYWQGKVGGIDWEGEYGLAYQWPQSGGSGSTPSNCQSIATDSSWNTQSDQEFFVRSIWSMRIASPIEVSGGTICRIDVDIATIGDVASLVDSIWIDITTNKTDSLTAGQPGTIIGTSEKIRIDNNWSFGGVVSFTDINLSVTAGDTVWIVLDGDGYTSSSSDYLQWAITSGAPDNEQYLRGSSTWTWVVGSNWKKGRMRVYYAN